MSKERVILISGMGADGRLFAPQWEGGLAFEVPDFPIPDVGDSMAAYAARLRDQIDLSGPCVVGGISFGGMVACELARLCRPRCVLLIASCRNRSAVPNYYRGAELISRIVPDFLVRRRCIASARLIAKLESLTDEQYQLVRTLSRDVPVPFLRRVARMILNWQAPDSFPCPVYHIHGDRDRIIPIRGVQPDEVVLGGGHLINMTHTEQVNQFIRRHLIES